MIQHPLADSLSQLRIENQAPEQYLLVQVLGPLGEFIMLGLMALKVRVGRSAHQPLFGGKVLHGDTAKLLQEIGNPSRNLGQDGGRQLGQLGEHGLMFTIDLPMIGGEQTIPLH